jgi:hypothetical protein
MVSNSGVERILAFLGRRAIVDELSIIDGRPRSATVVAERNAAVRAGPTSKPLQKNIPRSTNRWSGFSLRYTPAQSLD